MEEALQLKLESLEARATRLEREVDNEPDKDREMAKRAELTAVNNRVAAVNNRLAAVNNRIAQLQKEKNILLEQSRGKFLFLRREFYFLLEFVYFMWLLILITLDIINF